MRIIRTLFHSDQIGLTRKNKYPWDCWSSYSDILYIQNIHRRVRTRARERATIKVVHHIFCKQKLYTFSFGVQRNKNKIKQTKKLCVCVCMFVWISIIIAITIKYYTDENSIFSVVHIEMFRFILSLCLSCVAFCFCWGIFCCCWWTILLRLPCIPWLSPTVFLYKKGRVCVVSFVSRNWIQISRVLSYFGCCWCCCGEKNVFISCNLRNRGFIVTSRRIWIEIGYKIT